MEVQRSAQAQETKAVKEALSDATMELEVCVHVCGVCARVWCVCSVCVCVVCVCVHVCGVCVGGCVCTCVVCV